MGIIPKVKCSRCEKSYSGLQSKCPYCGARRSKGGKFTMPEPGDPKWRLAVGVLLLVAVLCTVIGLVNINSGDRDENAKTSTSETSPSPSETDSAEVSPSPETSDVTTTDVAESSPSPSTEALDSIESITIKWLYYNGSNEMTIDAGFSIELTAEVYPTTADVEVTWSSEDTSVCTVDENGKITGVGSGNTIITAEYNGVEGELKVRVK